MSVIAVTSSRTSPGATTLATGLATAWSHQCERSLLVEADPAGGVLSLRFDLAPTPSLATFGSDIRNGYSSDLIWSNTQDLRGVHCMPAPVDPRLAGSWTERVTHELVANLCKLGAPTIIDLGWVGESGRSLALAEAADTTLVVTTAHTAEVQALLFQVRQLTNSGANVALVVVGDKPNDPQEIASLAGVPLAAVLPDDRTIAAALSGAAFAPKKFRRSLLWRTMSGLAASLLDEQLMNQRSDSATEPATPQDISAAVSPGTMPQDVPVVMSPESVMTFDGTERNASLTPVTSRTVIPPKPARTPLPLEPVVAEADPFPPVAVGPFVQPGECEERLVAPTVQMLRQLLLSNGERHELTFGESVTIGRHSSCNIVISDREISRHHGTLTFTERGWTYTDNNSRNGSWVNGLACSESVLTANDELVIGQTRVAFSTARVASYV